VSEIPPEGIWGSHGAEEGAAACGYPAASWFFLDGAFDFDATTIDAAMLTR
jgi:hypothetical protein